MGVSPSDTHSKAEAILIGHGLNLKPLDEHGRFLAHSKQGRRSIEIQVKTRIGIYRQYLGRNLHLCFPTNRSGNERWFLIPHDKLVEIVGERTPWLDTYSWEVRGIYHSANPSRLLLEGIVDYEVM